MLVVAEGGAIAPRSSVAEVVVMSMEMAVAANGGARAARSSTRRVVAMETVARETSGMFGCWARID